MRRRMILRGEHFLPGEAKELGYHLQRLDYYELLHMRRQRVRMWGEFDREARSKGWSQNKRNIAWRTRVADWYVRSGYQGKKEKIGAWTFVSKKDVWFWFDDISDRLPEEKRYTNDQSSLRKKGSGPKERHIKARREADQARNQRWIDGLMRSVVREPEKDKQLTTQAQRLGWRGKSLYKTAQRRGYA